MHRKPHRPTARHCAPTITQHSPPFSAVAHRRTFLRWAAIGAIAFSVAAGLVGVGSAAAAPVAALPAVADTFVNANYPSSTFGAKPVLKVDDVPKTALVTFELPDSVATTSSAVVRLRATPASAAATVTVHRVDRANWDEHATTFNTAPRFGPAVASGSVVPGGWLEVPISAIPDADGLVSLAVSRSGSGPDVEFWSRESAGGAPILVLGGLPSGMPGPPRPTDPNPLAQPPVPPPVVAPPVVAPPVVAPPAPAPGPSPSPQTGGPFIAYEPDSFFRTPLPDNAPLDSQSALGISMVKANDGSDYPTINGVGGNPWGMPYAMGTCSDPIWKLSGAVASEVGFLTTEGFHAPSTFADELTGTSDSPIVVIDRCGVPSMPRGLTVWAAKASAAGPGRISVGAAGAFAHDSNGLDRRDPLSDSARNFRSRGAIPDAMVIRDDLLAAAIANGGDLGHVLHMFWWETNSASGAVHPMVGAESGKAGFGAEGMRLRIKPSVDLASRNCTPAGLAVARTLQHYGAYLGDNSGSSSGLKAEQGSNAITRDALGCVTWDDFVFVQRGWDPSVG